MFDLRHQPMQTDADRDDPRERQREAVQRIVDVQRQVDDVTAELQRTAAIGQSLRSDAEHGNPTQHRPGERGQAQRSPVDQVVIPGLLALREMANALETMQRAAVMGGATADFVRTASSANALIERATALMRAPGLAAHPHGALTAARLRSLTTPIDRVTLSTPSSSLSLGSTAADVGMGSVRAEAETAQRLPQAVATLASSGQPLPRVLRLQLERVLRTDLSAVQVHHGQAAAAAAAQQRADAFAVGAHIFFAAGKFAPQSRAGRWLVAHEVAHTVQQRGSAVRVMHFRPDAARDADEAAADSTADAVTADADHHSALAERANARFGPDAVALLRTTVGLPRRGSLDAEFMAAVASLRSGGAAATTPESAATAPHEITELDWPTLRDLPFFALPRHYNPVRNWYAGADAPWADMEPARRDVAIQALRLALEVAESDIVWSAMERRARLVVTPHFVQRAVAWQIWQRVGLELDGKLGNQALLLLGVHGAEADRREARTSIDAADGIHATGRSFVERLTAVVERSRVTALTGEVAPTVGIGHAMGGLSPAVFVEAMFAQFSTLVTSLFLPGSASATLDDILATLRLTRGAIARFSEVASTPGWAALISLIATPESATLQHARFREARVDPMLAMLAPLGAQVGCGIVMLSVLVGNLTGIDLSSEAAAQAGLLRAYLDDEAELWEPYFAALLRGESVDAPAPASARVRQLERAIRAFRSFWSTPYPGADVDPSTVPGASSVAVGARAGFSPDVSPLSAAAYADQIVTGDAAAGGNAMVAHSRGDERLAAAWAAIGSELPAGFAPTWAEYAAEFQTIRFLGGTATGHRIFLERLARAEASLPVGHHGRRGVVNGGNHASQLRHFESVRALSYHHLGLAIDISADHNPWISVGRRMDTHRDRPPVVAIVTWYAAWLMGRGEAMSALQASHIATAEHDTAAIYDRFAASSDATHDYLALATDRAALAARLAVLGPALPGPDGYETVPGSLANLCLDETTDWAALATRSRTATVDQWLVMIEAQRTAWHREVSRTEAFMTQDRELVIALRAAGLAWGACDFGGESTSGGDFMHFDARPIFGDRAYSAFRRALTTSEPAPAPGEHSERHSRGEPRAPREHPARAHRGSDPRRR